MGREALDDPDLDARMKDAGRTAGMRFTVVAEDGRVVAESSPIDPKGMENHGLRPEIVEARDRGRAVSHRRSSSVRRELWYASERVPGTQAVARAALDAREAEALIAREVRFPWLAGSLAVAVGALAAALLLAPTAAGVRRVSHALRRVQAGDLSQRVPVRGPDFLRGLSSSFNDTAQRLQEDVDGVRAERGRLSTVLDGMVEGVVAIDGDEVVRFVNGAARALLALPADATPEGRPIQEVVRDPSVLALVRGALRGGDAGEAEIVWYGSPRTLLQVTAAPVRDAGKGAIVLVRDVSTIRRLERMRTDFVANVSHELRTPLAAIAGAAETLAEGAIEDREAAPGFVHAIQRQTERLRALVDDLLTLSRLESAPETIERMPVDFALVVRQACEAVAVRARDAGLSFEVKAEGSLRVLGDPEALRRLVDNLVVNAVTYSPPSAWVRVTLTAEDGSAVLVVADGGIGIGTEHLERIFERFYRVDKARSRSKGGTGLGLAIVKHSVALHGGDIDVQSRPGAGSVFTVRIPRSKETERVLPA
jgi:two-component system phosphate regulon sensor histidine kinase PhoR